MTLTLDNILEGLAPAPATSVPSPAPAPAPQQQELESRKKFNRRFTLPATDAHDELTVTYAVGGVDSDTAPTVLAWQSFGVRIVVIDRPGMGGSTMVDVSLRLSHVSIAAHSCGVIYALNTINELPWILPPSNRKLYLFSPWVGLEHSMLSISSYLPSPLINKTTSAVSAPSSGRRKPLPRHERDETYREYCGVSAAEYSARSKELMHAMFKESIRGANHEALLLLRRGVPGGWGVCDDYKTYPDALEAKMREFSQETGTGTSRETGQKKGEEYFNKCFERFPETNVASSGDGKEHKCLLYESEVVPETTHDTVCLPQYEALPRALRDMLGRQE
ncbi:hypothetical protein V1505DRAFT_401971 [Lipomyces doorenjongii]